MRLRLWQRRRRRGGGGAVPGPGERGAAGAERGRAECCHPVAAGDTKVRCGGAAGVAAAASVPRGRCEEGRGAAGGSLGPRAEGRRARLSAGLTGGGA